MSVYIRELLSTVSLSSVCNSKDGPVRSQELQSQPGVPGWVSILKYFNHHLLPPGVCVNRQPKLSRAGTRSQALPSCWVVDFPLGVFNAVPSTSLRVCLQESLPE